MQDRMGLLCRLCQEWDKKRYRENPGETGTVEGRVWTDWQSSTVSQSGRTLTEDSELPYSSYRQIKHTSAQKGKRPRM